MVPEIWSVMDRIFCHFGQFFAHLPLKTQKIKIKKMKKNHLKISTFYIIVSTIMIR